MNKKVLYPSVEVVQNYINKFNGNQELTVVEDVVAEHISSRNIDAKLRDRSLELVGEIAHIEINGKLRNNYSFASKYCHWHQPEKYPIYDSYADNLLWRNRKQDKFIAFTQAELLQYPRIKQIIEDFKNHYGLSQFSFNDLDKFLWGYGKEVAEK